MADKSKIEWTDATWNPFRAYNLETGGRGHFCVHHSPGCQFCYAERQQPRFKNPVRYAAQDAKKVEIYLDLDILQKPHGWRRPRMVFVCSMTDLFYEGHSFEDIEKVWHIMEDAPQHTFQVLTKRPDRMREYLAAHHWTGKVYMNIWLGTSVEDQQRANERTPHLLAIPTNSVRFLSVEPLLGPVDLEKWCFDRGAMIRSLTRPPTLLNRDQADAVTAYPLDWIIVGGESGPLRKARPMNPDWVRGIRDQCREGGVPFFFKQWGAWGPLFNTVNLTDAQRRRGERHRPNTPLSLIHI